MREDWQILGLESPTDDLAIVKKAYAARLRIHRPDTDPEGFQRLREAYERILERLRPRPRSAALDAGLGLPSSSRTPPDLFSPPQREASPGTEGGPAPTMEREVTLPDIDLPSAPTTPPADRLDIALDPGPSYRRDLSEQWRSLWGDPDQRRSKDAWIAFLAGEEWLHLPTRRRLEMEILVTLQEAWQENELRWIHAQAWLLLERHFGWLERELALAKIFLEDFVDHLAEEIRRSGRRWDPDRFPTAPVVRSEPFDVGSREGWRFSPGAIFPILLVLSIVLRIGLHGGFGSGDRSDRIPWADGVGSEPDYHGREVAEPPMRGSREWNIPPSPEPAPAPERPIVRLRTWTDETGGILPNSCASATDPDETCPWTNIVQVLRAGREQDARLVLTVGEEVVETLAVELNIAQRLRLCSRRGKDVVAIEEGFDPCASKVVKAWSVDRLEFRSVGTAAVACDTSQSCRWKTMGF